MLTFNQFAAIGLPGVDLDGDLVALEMEDHGVSCALGL